LTIADLVTEGFLPGSVRKADMGRSMRLGTRIVTTALASASFGLLAASAAAQHMNARDAACREAGTTADAAACFSKESTVRDSELATLLDQIGPAIAGEELKLLNRAQRAWVNYRTLSCEAEYAMYGGDTGGSVTRLACREALTRDRIAQLHDAYDWRVEKYRWTIDHPSVARRLPPYSKLNRKRRILFRQLTVFRPLPQI